MKDVVVGCITNYNFEKIKYWVNSLDTCGFTGDKVMVCYNIGYDVAEELTKRNYKVLAFENNKEEKKLQRHGDFNICLERFYDIWAFFKYTITEEYRYMISTDVKDVVFQTNPSTWLENNIGDKKINVACESIRYKDEPWGKHNLLQCFPAPIFDQMHKKLIFNAGTISGDYKTLLDFFLNIYMFCGRSPENVPGGGGPDQAALNVLLRLQPFRSITNFAMSEHGYAAQLGTTADPSKIGEFRKYLAEPEPIMQNDLVCTSKGVPFSIVHQYDRVPEWKKIIEKKYE